MTPAHPDTPLRRSGVNILRESTGVVGGGSNSSSANTGVVDMNVTINDDEEERRQARRRTLLQTTGSSNDTTAFEDNETLKKCLEIYNGNKLSRENAWSLSLIDTLSTLLDRHHKSLNNFKVAGSSLEASSKVYGLRVDSIHTDVLRMSAGLNAQKFNERNFVDDDDDGVATGGDGAADPNSSAGGAGESAPGDKANAAKKTKPKRQRRLVSTITKNRDTLNARLDTVPLQDPVFGKLNSIVGSINSSNRLMMNILLTIDSELRLRTTFRFWDAQQLEECDFSQEPTPTATTTATGSSQPTSDNVELAPCESLFKVLRYEELKMRPLHSGYVISDLPEELPDEKEQRRFSMDSHFGGDDGGGLDNATDVFHKTQELSMAFDINAECEQVPEFTEPAPMLEVDCGDFDDLTSDERTAINKCRGLRRVPVLLEDLRPVDASSKLEYSYRPLDKIAQFWAGPSHWKFKRVRTRPSTLSQHGENVTSTRTTANPRGRRAAQALAKKRSKQLNFTEFHDELFIKLDNKYKARKTQIQKKWDQRKLKLPTDMQLDTQIFFKFTFAPGIPVDAIVYDTESANSATNILDAEDDEDVHHMRAETDVFDDHFADADDGCLGGAGTDAGDLLHKTDMLIDASAAGVGDVSGLGEQLERGLDEDNVGNNTVLEIPTSYDGAPSQVTKIIVPFAKRAKVIDMKNLKRCCTQLMHKQMKLAQEESSIPQHPIQKHEKYAHGMASFNEIYNHLPEILNKTMADGLSTSVAFYSILHLANDYNLRLIPQDDLDDFKIRQVISGGTPPTTPR